jgi:hypothetical protein
LVDDHGQREQAPKGLPEDVRHVATDADSDLRPDVGRRKDSRGIAAMLIIFHSDIV